MRYEDAYQYQNIMGPLVKLEADYDKQMKEAQTQEGVTVRWDMGLNKKRIAYFTFAQKDTDMRLVTGDELLLRHAGDGGRAAWQCQGTVVRLTAAEEVGLELRSQANVPIDTHHGFSVGLASNHISPTSPLHLAYISPTSRLHLAHISPGVALQVRAARARGAQGREELPAARGAPRGRLHPRPPPGRRPAPGPYP